MNFAEGLLLWSAIALYVAAFTCFLSAAVFSKDRHGHLAWWAFVSGFALHTLTIVVRWVESGHPPVLWTFEHALASSWFVALVFIAAVRWAPFIRSAGVVVVPFVLFVLGYGMMAQGTGVEPLPPPYRSNWLWVHVSFAWLAYSAFAFASFVALFHLLKVMAMRRGGGEGGVLARFPAPEALDELTFKVILFGFIGLTVEMGAGAIWAFGLWGRYWAWDPMETWTLISWVAYGLYLHLRVTMGWRGTRMAWVTLVAFVFILIAFGGIAYMKGLHTTLI